MQVQCRCGKRYDTMDVEPIGRYADATVWLCPGCGCQNDDRSWVHQPYQEILRQPILMCDGRIAFTRLTSKVQNLDKRVRMIFVFGSNEAGIHGGGAARTAHQKYGAVMGEGWGFTGKAFALPTKDRNIETLPLEKVADYVKRFLWLAELHPQLEFQVTRIGCGLAGFGDEEIAPLFANHPSNCLFDEAWKTYLPSTTRFWGTF
jgi:hypothetical protein